MARLIITVDIDADPEEESPESALAQLLDGTHKEGAVEFLDVHWDPHTSWKGRRTAWELFEGCDDEDYSNRAIDSPCASCKHPLLQHETSTRKCTICFVESVGGTLWRTV
jgi:hypothetical protein